MNSRGLLNLGDLSCCGMVVIFRTLLCILKIFMIFHDFWDFNRFFEVFDYPKFLINFYSWILNLFREKS